MKTIATVKTLAVLAFLGSFGTGATAQIIDVENIIPEGKISMYKPEKADPPRRPLNEKLEDEDLVFPDHDPSPYLTPTEVFYNNVVLTAKIAIDTIPQGEAEAVVIENKVKSLQMLDIRVYPNPATEIINIDLSTLEGVSIKLIDISGRLVLDEYVGQAGSVYSIDVRTLQNGVYILLVETSKMRDSRTVIIRS